ncbi:MAG: shikimate dehydrogenase [Oscillospiraceae bacterium]|nr:shikimate dehydrogenase [Oscillospiraceae bacterium]MDD4369132.1 shikimate dehydrogenase [Oscillospiraceae bacterium]
MTRQYRFALLGHPLGHSLSPQIHQAIYQAAGVKAVYDLLDTPEAQLPLRLPQLLETLDGFNITIPYKEKVLDWLPTLDASAQACGAVNTVACAARRGYNTDIIGVRSLGLPYRDREVLLLGSGGAARVMAQAALEAGCRRLSVWSRHPERSRQFCAELLRRQPQTDPARVRALEQAQLQAWAAARPELQPTVLLNATPAGMWPDCRALPLPEALLRQLLAGGRLASDHSLRPPVVFDAIYNPTATRLLLLAASYGWAIHNGLQMLLSQALEACGIWLGPERITPQLRLTLQQTLPSRLAADLWRRQPPRLVLSVGSGSGAGSLTPAWRQALSRLLAQKGINRLTWGPADLAPDCLSLRLDPLAAPQAGRGERQSSQGADFYCQASQPESAAVRIAEVFGL